MQILHMPQRENHQSPLWVIDGTHNARLAESLSIITGKHQGGELHDISEG